MIRARRSSQVFAAYVVLAAVFFLAQQFGRGTPLFRDVITPARIAPFSSLAKLAAQLFGAVFAARCAVRYGKGNPARAAWLSMSAWLGFWFLGQTVLATYAPVSGADAPVPSIGDLFFGIGYVFVVFGLRKFVSAYRESGFAPGSTREDTQIALVACGVFGVIGYFVLAPVALSAAPIASRLVNIGYPLLDLLTLIPALVLLRITVAFRGGQVWRVWAAILVGILFATGGDVVFADLSPVHLDAIGPLADLLFIVGYSFCAYGIWLQYVLVAE